MELIVLTVARSDLRGERAATCKVLCHLKCFPLVSNVTVDVGRRCGSSLADVPAGKMLLPADGSNLFLFFSPDQHEVLRPRRPLHRGLSEARGDGGQRLLQYPFFKAVTVL